MNSSQLLNSAFKRICVFAEKSGFKILNDEIGVAFYYYPNAKVYSYVWRWRNKKEMLLGCKKIGITSLFTNIFARYEYFKKYNIKNTEPISEPISENTSNFINVCRFLNGCHSIEEITLKMDLMGI